MGHLVDPVGLVALVDAVDLKRYLYLSVPEENHMSKELWVKHEG